MNNMERIMLLFFCGSGWVVGYCMIGIAFDLDPLVHMRYAVVPYLACVFIAFVLMGLEIFGVIK